jgi:hypothetical protein
MGDERDHVEDLRHEGGLVALVDHERELGGVVGCPRVAVRVEVDFDAGDLFAGCGELGREGGFDCVLVLGEDAGEGPSVRED